MVERSTWNTAHISWIPYNKQSDFLLQKHFSRNSWNSLKKEEKRKFQKKKKKEPELHETSPGGIWPVYNVPSTDSPLFICAL